LSKVVLATIVEAGYAATQKAAFEVLDDLEAMRQHILVAVMAAFASVQDEGGKEPTKKTFMGWVDSALSYRASVDELEPSERVALDAAVDNYGDLAETALLDITAMKTACTKVVASTAKELDIHLPDSEIKLFVSQTVAVIRGEPVVSAVDEPVRREDVLCVAQPPAPRSRGAAGATLSAVLANPEEFTAVILERKIKELWHKCSELAVQANLLSKAAKKSSGKDHTKLMLVAATGSGHNVVSGPRSTSEYGTPLTSAVMPSPASRKVSCGR
jgi:hypothetical protein